MSPQQLSQAFAAAINAGDLTGAIALWDAEARIVAADGAEIAGREAIETALGALIDHGTTVEVEIGRMYHAGDTALATGTLTLRASDGTSQRSSSVVVYRRADDGWRLAIDAPWGLPTP